MAGISDFLSSLRDTEWDILMQVMNDLSDSTSPERLDSLRQFLKTITREIDQINQKRDALGHRRDNADALIGILESRLRATPNVELMLFKNMLVNWKATLQTEIAESRPDLKLEKKYDTEKKRNLLVELQPIVTKLGESLSELNRKVAPPPADKALGITPSERGKLDSIIENEGSKVK